MLRTLQEWYDRCDRGTSGDMVYDILKDWKEEKELLEEKVRQLSNLIKLDKE